MNILYIAFPLDSASLSHTIFSQKFIEIHKKNFMAAINEQDETVLRLATELLPQATIVLEEPGKIKITVSSRWGESRNVYFWKRPELFGDEYYIYVPDSTEDSCMKARMSWYNRGDNAVKNWNRLSEAEKQRDSCFVVKTRLTSSILIQICPDFATNPSLMESFLESPIEIISWNPREFYSLTATGAHLKDMARCWGPVKVTNNMSAKNYEQAKKLFENQLMSHKFI